MVCTMFHAHPTVLTTIARCLPDWSDRPCFRSRPRCPPAGGRGSRAGRAPSRWCWRPAGPGRRGWPGWRSPCRSPRRSSAPPRRAGPASPAQPALQFWSSCEENLACYIDILYLPWSLGTRYICSQRVRGWWVQRYVGQRWWEAVSDLHSSHPTAIKLIVCNVSRLILICILVWCCCWVFQWHAGHGNMVILGNQILAVVYFAFIWLVSNSKILLG